MFFFFFKQKTAYEMRISDWSSDVCSSDLLGAALFELDPSSATKKLGDVGGAAKKAGDMIHSSLSARLEKLKRTMQQGLVNFINDKVMPVIDRFAKWMKDKIGRASCRSRVCQ